MSKHLEEHVLAALSHLLEADNEMEDTVAPVQCVAQGLIRAALLSLNGARELLLIKEFNFKGRGEPTGKLARILASR